MVVSDGFRMKGWRSLSHRITSPKTILLLRLSHYITFLLATNLATLEAAKRVLRERHKNAIGDSSFPPLYDLNKLNYFFMFAEKEKFMYT
jgi:hypothetical protein